MVSGRGDRVTARITVDIIWLLVGLLVGFMGGGTLLLLLNIGDQWATGFGKGWSAAIKYEQKKREGEIE